MSCLQVLGFKALNGKAKKVSPNLFCVGVSRKHLPTNSGKLKIDIDDRNVHVQSYAMLVFSR